MSPRTPLPPRLYFSYGQFLVYDCGVKAPGSLWTDAHSAQGFARRESTVSFGTLLEFGHADVFYCRGAFRHDGAHERVIAVPFSVFTGKIMVDGPEEVGIARTFGLPLGNYRIVAAQRLVGGGEELVELFAEKLDDALGESRVIIADDLLNPPVRLVETAEIA
jgi:hypothetical protein